MENQPVLKTPREWEDMYMQQVQDAVTQWQNYCDQLKAGSGGYFGTQGSYAALDYARRIRQFFDQYDTTAQWFRDRNMPRFPDYLAFVKKDFDGVINIFAQMYQDSLNTDQKIFAINAAANTSMLNTYNDIYTNQQKVFDEMNKKWMDHFKSS
ncbi:MAG TPA: hypothetical protein VHB54_18325 [Mucilaginibacter sp.]|nr:hypothetical protein [Mucilaginibacter sp.]